MAACASVRLLMNKQLPAVEPKVGHDSADASNNQIHMFVDVGLLLLTVHL